MAEREYPAWVRDWPCSDDEVERRWAAVNKYGAPPSNANSRYGRYLLSPHWRRLRGIILVMADSTCARCGGHARHVHHRTYARIGRERIHDLEPLCEPCHDTEHERTPTVGNILKASLGAIK